MADINRMLRGSVAIYCEAPKAVADDISHMLRTGVEEIETLRSRVARLEEFAKKAGLAFDDIGAVNWSRRARRVLEGK